MLYRMQAVPSNHYGNLINKAANVMFYSYFSNKELQDSNERELNLVACIGN